VSVVKTSSLSALRWVAFGASRVRIGWKKGVTDVPVDFVKRARGVLVEHLSNQLRAAQPSGLNYFVALVVSLTIALINILAAFVNTTWHMMVVGNIRMIVMIVLSPIVTLYLAVEITIVSVWYAFAISKKVSGGKNESSD
jgi:ABC-type multidrug transport system fused ATPase/permease subunit